MRFKFSGKQAIWPIISSTYIRNQKKCYILPRQFPKLTIDRVRRIDPTSIDFASSKIEDEEANLVKLDEKNVKLFTSNDELKGYFLVIGRDGDKELISFRKGTFTVSERFGKRFILYLNNEERRSSEGTGVERFPFYIFDLESEHFATVYLRYFTSFADQRSPNSFWFHWVILDQLP